MVKLLLQDKRVDPNDIGETQIFGFSAIEYASSGKYDIVRVLLKDERVSPVIVIKCANDGVASRLIQSKMYGYKIFKTKYDKYQQDITEWYKETCYKRKQHLLALKWTLRNAGIQDMYYSLKKIIKNHKV